MKILVVYHSRTGNTKQMAEAIAEACNGVLKSIDEVKNKDFLNAEVIVLGSPTYFRCMSAEMKKIIDKSIDVYGKLNNKNGFIFTSSGTKKDGEKCLNSLFEALDCHGVNVVDRILVVGKPKKNDLERCRGLVRNLL